MADTADERTLARKYESLDCYLIENVTQLEHHHKSRLKFITRDSHTHDDWVEISFNGLKEVKINRRTMNTSCFFLDRLLFGPYKESLESYIIVYVDDCFSFAAFEAVLLYASCGHFDRTHEIDYYMQIIQLAHLWLYDELVKIVEGYLMSFIHMDTLLELHTLANLLKLGSLKRECEAVEEIVDSFVGSLDSDWGRCSLRGHQTHSYARCPEKQYTPIEENWDEIGDFHDQDRNAYRTNEYVRQMVRGHIITEDSYIDDKMVLFGRTRTPFR